MSAGYLVYFADPMCSWCYGFGPELEELLRESPGLRVDLVMGGLRAFNAEKADSAFRDRIAGHWAHVAKESGLAFNDAALAREDFVYDTEPACRAVVAVRLTDPARALPYLKSVQRAFYVEGRDVTQPEVLADIAADEGLDRAAFLALLASPAAKDAVLEDFSVAKKAGVRGFPTLVMGYSGARYFLLASGFMRAPALAERLARIEALATVSSQPARPEA